MCYISFTLRPVKLILLYKKEKYKFDIKIDWYAFEIQDLFTIGYGMDYHLKFRGLNDIYALS